jgi:hypothetical protein
VVSTGHSQARPATGRRGGPASALAPFPVPGRSLLFALLRVACHCWGLTRGCLRESPGGRPHSVATRRGRPPVYVRRRLCAGFLQCGLFVEVYSVDCVLSMGGWLVLVRGGGGGLLVTANDRGPPTSTSASTSCLSQPVLPRLLWWVVDWVGILLDVIGGVKSSLWEGCYPALH